MSLCRTFTVLLASLILLATPVSAKVKERCNTYAQGVRTAHSFYFGVEYPYWYSIAQLEKESGCRDVISKDGIGSEGPAQITYRWWAKDLTKQGIPEVSTTGNHLKAQAYINYAGWKQTPHKKLWIMYQIYNGGGLVLKEIKAAGVVDWQAARDKCNRRVITFDNGQKIDACDINYSYSKKIEAYSRKYQVGKDSEKYPYW